MLLFIMIMKCYIIIMKYLILLKIIKCVGNL